MKGGATMVKVVKDDMTLTIPAGAVKDYISTGWKLADSKHTESAKEEVKSKVKEPVKEDDSDSEDNYEDDDVVYVDPEELAERPLEELDAEELRILAEYKGIDVSHISSVKKLRAAIEALE